MLTQHFRCLAIDLPLGGHSIPLKYNADFTATGIANLIREFLDYLSIRSVVLISNDTGNAYGQVFCSQFPARVNKFILSNGEGLDVFPPAKFAYLKYAVRIPGFAFSMAKVFSLKKFLRSDQILGLLTHRATNDELYTLYVKTFIDDPRIQINFSRVARTWSKKITLAAAEKLRNFNKPVLILWGKEDKTLFPIALGIQLSKLFPKAKIVLIDNSRTYIQEDNPEQMARHIKDFLFNTLN